MPRSKRLTKTERKQIIAARRQFRDETLRSDPTVVKNLRRVTKRASNS